jgi:hypothetical protein
MKIRKPALNGAWQAWGDTWVRSGWLVQGEARTGRFRVLDPSGRMAAWGDEAGCLSLARARAPRDTRRRAVVLMHGMGRTRRCMARLGRTLDAAGWAVANLDYPSLLEAPHVHAARARRVATALAEGGADEVAFVGHSLGGIIGRIALSQGWPAGPLVTIGTPNRGAALAAWLAHMPLYRMAAGDCGIAVTPGGVAEVPVPDRRILVIAGGNGRRGFNPLLRGDNDGIVAVDETRLRGAETEFRLTRTIHTVLPSAADVIGATIGFLEAHSNRQH